jgi:hypothetical protein
MKIFPFWALVRAKASDFPSGENARRISPFVSAGGIVSLRFSRFDRKQKNAPWLAFRSFVYDGERITIR